MKHILALSILCSAFAPLFSAAPASAERTVTIGWAGPLSGNSAVLGVDSAKAVEMVFDKANAEPGSDIKFKLVAEDDQYSTGKAVLAYRKLVDIDKVPAIIFLTYGGLFAAAPLAEKDDILLVDPLDCNEEVAKLPEHTVCVAAMTEAIGRLNAETAVKNGHKKAAILYFLDDPFMSTVVSSTEEYLKANGGTVAVSAGHRGGESDYRSVLMRAKKAGVDSIYLYGYDELAIAMKQARELAIDAQFYATATIMSPGFAAGSGASREGSIFSVFTPSNEAKYSAFIDEFSKRNGRRPILDIATVPSFDIANVIVEFSRSYDGDPGSKEFARALRAHLYGLRGYQGASGDITMSPEGVTRTLGLKTYRIKDGERRQLS